MFLLQHKAIGIGHTFKNLDRPLHNWCSCFLTPQAYGRSLFKLINYINAMYLCKKGICLTVLFVLLQEYSMLAKILSIQRKIQYYQSIIGY